MGNSSKPQEKLFNKGERPKATDVFYATGINIDINATEIILTFDQHFPSTVPQAKSVVLNSNAVFQLRDVFINLANAHEENLEAMKNNERQDY